MSIKPSQVHALASKLSYDLTALTDFQEELEESLSRAQDAKRPNEAKIETLELQLAIIEDAITDLENCISTLEDYS